MPKDIATLRSIAAKAASILRAVPESARVRDDWGQDGFEVTLKVDADRANMAGVTNQDVAQSSSTALSGASLTTLRRDDQQIPVVSRLQMEERATLSDIQNLYVYSSQSNNKVPLLEVSKIENELQTLRIRRLEHFRTISVESFTVSAVLSSEVFSAAAPKIAELQKSLHKSGRRDGGFDRHDFFGTGASISRSSRCWCWLPRRTAWPVLYWPCGR